MFGQTLQMPPNQHYHVHHVFPAHACLSFCIRHILFDSPRREGHPLILIFKCQVATYFDVCRIYWELLKCVSQQGEQYIISLITNKKDCVVMHNFQNFFCPTGFSRNMPRKKMKRRKTGGIKTNQETGG